LGVLDLALCLLAEVVLIAVRFETDGSEAVSPVSGSVERAADDDDEEF
jgi:hypothetical protein